MDSLKIESGIMRGIVNKIIMKILKKNGFDISVNILELDVNRKEQDDNVYVRTNVALTMRTETLKKLVDKM